MDFTLELVVVPVTDVDRAKAFYSEQCGFHVDVDHSVGDDVPGRPADPAGLGLLDLDRQGPREVGAGLDPGPPAVRHRHRRGARRARRSRRSTSRPVRHIEDGEWLDGHGGPWNSFMFFSDPDGNGWAIQEKPTSS